MRRLALAFPLLAVIPAAAVASLASETLEAPRGTLNVDGDSVSERLRVDAVAHWTGVPHVRAVLEDECGGRRRDVALSRGYERIRRLEARDVDGTTARPEIVLVADSRRPRPHGIARVIRYDDPQSRGCGVRTVLFGYSTDKAVSGRPAGSTVRRFSIRLADYAPRHAGLEIVLREALAGSRPAARVVVSRWRLDRAARRYVRYG